MSTKEQGHALDTVRRIYGALIAAAIIPLIEAGIVRDTQEAIMSAATIVAGRVQ